MASSGKSVSSRRSNASIMAVCPEATNKRGVGRTLLRSGTGGSGVMYRRCRHIIKSTYDINVYFDREGDIRDISCRSSPVAEAASINDALRRHIWGTRKLIVNCSRLKAAAIERHCISKSILIVDDGENAFQISAPHRGIERVRRNVGLWRHYRIRKGLKRRGRHAPHENVADGEQARAVFINQLA